MNASFFINFPSQLHWNADELTAAVPLRLHELFAYDARRDAPFVADANVPELPGHRDYLPTLPLPTLFRVR
jgi:hypothetical protein